MTIHDPTVAVPAGVPESVWATLAKPDGTQWAISERDATGEVIGTAYRHADGGKTCKPGGKRGLIIAWPLPPYAGSIATNPVFVCEGASDTAALLGLGLDAVGVPMAGHCGEMLAALLDGRHAVLVADADSTGRSGAAKVAATLAKSAASVRIIEPPAGAKDARAAVIAGADRAAFMALVAAAEPARPEPVPGGPVIVRLSDVKPEPVSWLWHDRIALGKLTLIAGDPGLGKSFLTLDIAARVSRGAPWPDGPGVPTTAGGVVLLSAEDGIADTIRPRLDAAEADPSRVVALEAIRAVSDHGREVDRAFDLTRDLPALESAIRSVEGCRLVVIDPVTAYLGATDSHNNSEIRGLLAPLSALAARTGVAVVAVTHLNKSGNGPAIYRAMGSLGFTAAARAAWSVSKDKDDPKRRLLLPIKNNIAPDTGGLAYRIVPARVVGGAAVEWEPDPVNVTADDALGGDRDDNDRRTQCDDAADWLREYLADGPKPAKDILAESKAAGFAKRTLDRAKANVGVVTRKAAFGGGWTWELAEERHGVSEERHTPEAGNLRAKPVEIVGIVPKVATPAEVASFAGSNGALGAIAPSAGDWGEVCP